MFLTFAAFQLISCASDSGPKPEKYLNADAKGLDYKVYGKKDEHRFGVELKENKQFHHTTTGSND